MSSPSASDRCKASAWAAWAGASLEAGRAVDFREVQERECLVAVVLGLVKAQCLCLAFLLKFLISKGALADPATLTNPTLADEVVQPPEPSADDIFDQMYNDWFGGPEDDLVQMDTASADPPGASADPTPAASETASPASSPAADDSLADETQEPAEEVAADDPAEDEGSGGGGFFSGLPSFGGLPSLPSFPSFGLPSFPSFFRKFSSRQSRSMYSDRQSRQLYSPCTDRITLPCIVEDFIGAGMGDIPSCIPVHCGSSLCQAGIASCKVETSVTPFHIGVHFGDGKGNKGSPEDNIGACLRYKQLPCS